MPFKQLITAPDGYFAAYAVKGEPNNVLLEQLAAIGITEDGQITGIVTGDFGDFGDNPDAFIPATQPTNFIAYLPTEGSAHRLTSIEEKARAFLIAEGELERTDAETLTDTAQALDATIKVDGPGTVEIKFPGANENDWIEINPDLIQKIALMGRTGAEAPEIAKAIIDGLKEQYFHDETAAVIPFASADVREELTDPTLYAEDVPVVVSLVGNLPLTDEDYDTFAAKLDYLERDFGIFGFHDKPTSVYIKADEKGPERTILFATPKVMRQDADQIRELSKTNLLNEAGLNLDAN